MNLSQSDSLNYKLPYSTNPPTYKRDKYPSLGCLRVGYNPKSGLKTVFASTDNEQQQMQDAAVNEHAQYHEEGNDDDYDQEN